MSDSNSVLTRMEAIVSNVKSQAVARWASSKLWITAGTVLALIWLFKTELALVVWPITAIVGIFLVCRTVETVSAGNNKVATKKIIADALSKDGLSDAEAEVIEKT